MRGNTVHAVVGEIFDLSIKIATYNDMGNKKEVDPPSGDEDDLGNQFDESNADEVKNTNTLPVKVLKFTDELVVKRVYFLGRMIAKLFHEENLYYWTTAGTSLGKRIDGLGLLLDPR